MACSYSDGLSRRVNKDVQRIMESNEYHRIFPRTTLPPRGSKYTRSTNLIEIPNRKGSFRSTGIGGSITGMGCEILGIDDPLKDRQEANSITIRDRIWDWYTSTAYTRLSPGGGVLVTLTRWHEDDLAGDQYYHWPLRALARALVLGDRSLLSDEMRDQLNATGTAHLIAISGLHVTVLAFALALLLTWVVIETPLSQLFHFAELDLMHYGIAMVLAFSIIPIIEVYKSVMRGIEKEK